MWDLGGEACPGARPARTSCSCASLAPPPPIFPPIMTSLNTEAALNQLMAHIEHNPLHRAPSLDAEQLDEATTAAEGAVFAALQALPPSHLSLFAAAAAGNAGPTVVDLRSDTVTQPTLAMLDAMTIAHVGDDIWGDDPTTRLLEETAARVLGKEAALLMPSGTMGNLVAAMAWCPTRGAEILAGAESHLVVYEQGGTAQVAGIHTRTVPNLPDGTLCLDTVEAYLRPRGSALGTGDTSVYGSGPTGPRGGDDWQPARFPVPPGAFDQADPHYPVTGLISLENTHNRCGGRVVPIDHAEALGRLAGPVPIHMDGARVFNSAVALGRPVADLTAGVSSVQVCLSKGLSAPVGSILAGPAEMIARSRRMRKVLGGGLRQSGVIAAAGLVALGAMVPRLAVDHLNARRLAAGIQEIGAAAGPAGTLEVSCDPATVDTNIVLFQVRPGQAGTGATSAPGGLSPADQLVARLRPHGIWVGSFGPNQVRAVTHRHITEDQIDRTLLALKQELAQG
ncbi:hypothetical protein H696_03356 [Fonticula alba]|uniref:Aromatic amino acid beta-eliminating lyase/threonine aldolase domain-containing protein n=1 Tax=Fonticula alba TaxID=691883 RepID=A0A058Z6I0_FONAL|nr:hypothetical protein H696_03356 [Fonticula alba]KCV69889.1 hypothetical protein H696_03356 [Fonticula alba]|eukprot:XP_009495495.1 hypothetical protein H696_03356 [Fonticula alba]